MVKLEKTLSLKKLSKNMDWKHGIMNFFVFDYNLLIKIFKRYRKHKSSIDELEEWYV